MGNCFVKPKKSTAGIAPCDFIKASPTITLYGPPAAADTSYIRFALLYKPVSLHFVPSDPSPFGSSDPTIQFGAESVSGSRETLLQFIEEKFPRPCLRLNRTTSSYEEETTPLVVLLARLQHRSVTWHMKRVVRWGEDLVKRKGKRGGDPTVGSVRMEVRKLGRSYSQLLEVMFEHAQMEERVVFPILDLADRGVSKAANEEHARDLPIMNGIKEDLKAIAVMEVGSPAYQEAISNLSTRLKSLQGNCKQHFEEEERDLLPLVEAAAEMNKEKQERVLEQCLDAMQATHSHLLRFFVEGLLPHEAIQYLDLITRYSDNGREASMLEMLFD